MQVGPTSGPTRRPSHLRGDHLLRHRQRLVLFVLEVADAAREVQVAVDPEVAAVLPDEAAGLVDARALLRVVRLVVERERYRLAAAAEHLATGRRVIQTPLSIFCMKNH